MRDSLSVSDSSFLSIGVFSAFDCSFCAASSTSKETSAALHKVNYPSKSNPTACGLIYESVLKVRPFYPEPSMERETLDKRDVVTIPGKNAVKINPTKGVSMRLF